MIKRFFVFLIAVLGTMGLTMAVPAQAAPEAQDKRTIITAPLNVVGSAEQVQPNDTGVGNCGSIWLEVRDNGVADGVGIFDYGFNSTQGWVFDRVLTVRWANAANAVINAFDDNGLMLGSSFSRSRDVTTGAGTVVSRLVTVITHYNGTVCIGYVGDTGTVA